MRNFLGIVGGIVVGFVLAALMGMTGELLFPSGIRVERYTAEAAAAVFPRLPLGAQLFSLLSWTVASLAGAALAKKISGRAWVAWTVAGFFIVYVLLTLLILPVPIWMQVLAAIGPIVGGFVGNHVVRGHVAPTPETSADASL